MWRAVLSIESSRLSMETEKFQNQGGGMRVYKIKVADQMGHHHYIVTRSGSGQEGTGGTIIIESLCWPSLCFFLSLPDDLFQTKIQALNGNFLPKG